MNFSKSLSPRRRLPLFFLSALLMLLGAPFVSSAQARTEAFQELAPSPAPLTAVAADPTSGLIYGQEDRGEAFFVYNPRTNEWSELAPAPLGPQGSEAGATYLDGKIYVAYVENFEELGVYDIALGTWSTIPNPAASGPQKFGTGIIAAGNGEIYLAAYRYFVRYDPSTGVTTPLAEVPGFTDQPEGGFEKWGGMQVVGSKVYAQQGDGEPGFAAYDIATGSWTDLASAPPVKVVGAEEFERGPVLGSAYDPVTRTYFAYGTYGGRSLYRFDLDSGAWTTSPTPFTVSDGGLAYLDLPGLEGVYMVEGRYGTRFFRFTERIETDLATTITAEAAPSTTGGTITYSIAARNIGPEKATSTVITDALPAGAQLVSATSPQGSCAGGATVVCTLGTVPAGGTATATVRVDTGFGTYSDTARSTTGSFDTNAANDSASVTTTVTEPAKTTRQEAVRCVVPRIRGLSLRAAKALLLASGCSPGKMLHHHGDKIRRGKVIRGITHRETSLPAGSPVNIQVSLGRRRH